MSDILNSATDILDFIVKGIKGVFDFLLSIPNLINSLISLIPSPFKEVIMSFIGIIIIYFIAKAVVSIVNWSF